MKKRTIIEEGFVKKLYNDSLWVFLFTRIRFWTGSFSQLETFVPKSGKILDLGCGYGIFANYLAVSSRGREILGVDMDSQKIAHADKGVRSVSFSVGDATKMRLENLDGIVLHDVLHHLNSYEEQAELIKDCILMLKKKGTLLIVEVDNKPLWKLVLGRLTDLFMYKGQTVYYRYKNEMLKLLQTHFAAKNIHAKTLDNNPFPQVVYICQKT